MYFITQLLVFIYLLNTHSLIIYFIRYKTKKEIHKITVKNNDLLNVTNKTNENEYVCICVICECELSMILSALFN